VSTLLASPNGATGAAVPGRTPGVIRVLVVDDSALVRRILTDALSKHEDIEVVGTATDPYVARERIAQLRPDVITLDIEMPRMDGLSFLSKLMRHFPLPVVVCSSLTPQNSETALRALSLGAVEVIAKPGSSLAAGDVAEELARAVRAASHARVTKRVDAPEPPAMLRPAIATIDSTNKLIALGASTGGTQALEVVLRRFPVDAPGTVIVQHMPEHFTASFAKRLDSVCQVRVQEAKDGDYVVPGLALVAPGGKHLVVQASGARWVARVKDGPKVHHQRPAVDVLFQSVARSAGRNAVGAILTGMGADGAKGMLAMREAGAYTVAQNEETCVVYGMPREAVKLEAAVDVLALERIAEALLTHTHSSVHAVAP
jgi:two-component system, chemotaxis family, protein-glutamate methylesterase/glutaminase